MPTNRSRSCCPWNRAVDARHPKRHDQPHQARCSPIADAILILKNSTPTASGCHMITFTTSSSFRNLETETIHNALAHSVSAHSSQFFVKSQFAVMTSPVSNSQTTGHEFAQSGDALTAKLEPALHGVASSSSTQTSGECTGTFGSNNLPERAQLRASKPLKRRLGNVHTAKRTMPLLYFTGSS
jgi:hypothetical protein